MMTNSTETVPALLDSLDWAYSPLGPLEGWTAPLRCAVDIMRHSETAMFLVWGEDRIFLYNEAYLPVLGSKHPHALGRPMGESWREVWPEVSILLQHTFDGKPQRFEEYPFSIARNGKLEQAWFDFSYTPVYDGSQVGGVLCILNETTRQVLAERATKQQAETLRHLFEKAPGFMAVLRGSQHVFELANASYRELIGGRDPVGKPIRTALPEIAEQGFYELLDEVLRTGEPYYGRRVPVILERGTAERFEQRWLDFIYQPMLDHLGAVSGVFIQGADVTRHFQTEQALQTAATRSEQERDQLNVLLDTVPAAIAIFDLAGKLVKANAGMNTLWGNHPRPDNIYDYVSLKGWWADGTSRHGTLVQTDEWPIVRVLRGEQRAHGIIEIEAFSESERRTFLIVATAIRDGAGTPTGALVARTDLTEQLRVESAMRESEAKFRVIANSIPHLVWTNLPDGTHDFFNEQWHEFTGLAGVPDTDDWTRIVHADDQQRAAALWAQALASGQPYEIEYRLFHHPSQQFRWCLSRALPIHDAKGRLIRWLGTCTDVHEQRMLTDELRRLGEKKDEFLAMLAHELRNPLAPIKAASELLKMGELDVQRQMKAAAVIERQVNHMTELVNDLLDVSRVTRGLVELDQRSIDLKSVVAGAVEQAKPLIERRGHVLHVHIDAEHAMVRGDSTRLVQVVVNLLSNAAKYTPQRGRLDVSVAADDKWVRITVQDNGSGIEPALLPHVFDIFTQGIRTPDRSEGGLGIGLALVKSLVVMHGGTVLAHSEGIGKGSRFEVRLPTLLMCKAENNAVTGLTGRQAPRISRRILIVDDNVDAAESLAQLLEAMGNEVKVSFDGASAIETAAAFQPDTLVLDVGLPDMSGYDLARRLQATDMTTNALFIALTGYGQAHDRVLSQAAGFHHHFVKPANVDMLCEVLNNKTP